MVLIFCTLINSGHTSTMAANTCSGKCRQKLYRQTRKQRGHQWGAEAKRALQEIWMAETKKDALVAFDVFVETWGVKYDKAVECLIKDRAALLAFYDFPAELGSICARPTSSKARSQQCVTAPYARRGVS